jgi:hypothetical protein
MDTDHGYNDLANQQIKAFYIVDATQHSPAFQAEKQVRDPLHARHAGFRICKKVTAQVK